MHDSAGIALLAVGLLAAFIGGIMLIVAAFRVSIVWGICAVFVPFAWLAFLFCHWSRGKAGFLVNILGVLLMAGGIAAAPDTRQALMAAVTGLNGDFSLADLKAQMDTPQDLTAQIAATRARIGQLEAELSRGGSELDVLFKDLSAKRAKLAKADASAIAAFNAEAAQYAQRNAALKEVRDGLNSARAELEGLLARRGAANAGGAPKGASGAPPAGNRRVAMAKAPAPRPSRGPRGRSSSCSDPAV